MRIRILLNQSFLAAVVIGSTILLLSCATVFAQQAEPIDEEQEIDLDSLDEELGEQPQDESDNKEKFLPVNPALVEFERHSALTLVALIVLMPLSSMFLPLERLRKDRRSLSRQNRKTNS